MSVTKQPTRPLSFHARGMKVAGGARVRLLNVIFRKLQHKFPSYLKIAERVIIL
jgi:hypothetical protein